MEIVQSLVTGIAFIVAIFLYLVSWIGNRFFTLLAFLALIVFIVLTPATFNILMWILVFIAVVLYVKGSLMVCRVVLGLALFIAAISLYTSGDDNRSTESGTQTVLSPQQRCDRDKADLIALRVQMDKNMKDSVVNNDTVTQADVKRDDLRNEECKTQPGAIKLVEGTVDIYKVDADTYNVVFGDKWAGLDLRFSAKCANSNTGEIVESVLRELKCEYVNADKNGLIIAQVEDGYRKLVQKTELTTSPSPSPSPTFSKSDQPLSKEDANRIRENLRRDRLVADEYASDQLNITKSPDLNQVVERGVTSFRGANDKELRSPADVGAFLRGSSEQSKAARRQVEAAIREDFGDEEVASALDGSCYVALQPSVASQILGTAYFKDGKVIESENWRTVGTKDIYWLCIMPDYTIVPDATIRADCANPGLSNLRPIAATTPKAPPVSTCGERCRPVNAPAASPSPAPRPMPSAQPTVRPTTKPKPAPLPAGKDHRKSTVVPDNSDPRTGGVDPVRTLTPQPPRQPQPMASPSPVPVRTTPYPTDTPLCPGCG